MSRCLGDRGLLLAYYGEGPAAARAHLGTCLRCAADYRRLVRDLEVIGQTLRDGPAVARVRLRRGVGRRRWIMVAAALAAVVVLGGLEVRIWRESASWVRPEPVAADAETFLQEVSAILSSTGDGGGPELVMITTGPNLADLLGAQGGESTEERDEGPLPGM